MNEREQAGVVDHIQDHEQLLHFLYAAPIGLIQTTLDGEIELINSVSAKLLLPLAPERKLTNLFAVLAGIVPDLQARVKRAAQLNCSICEGLRYELRAEGREHVVSFSLTKVDGQRLIAVLTDVTQLAHHERALQESQALYQDELLRSRERLERMVEERTAELQQSQTELELRALQAEAASKAKSDFLANMSHEIRTPLNAILGNLELLRRDRPAPTQLERIGHLEVSAKYLLGTLNDVLELSKIEAGELPLEYVDFRLDDVLDQVRAIVCDAAAAKGLTLQFETQGVPQALHGDPARLAQILVNYSSNAIKFTEQGGICLRVRQVAQDAISCELVFEVHDTGIGVSPEQSAQLFAAFERGSSGAMGSVRGAGLGLAINARLAELMYGQVGASGEPGKGSVFWLKVRFGKAAPTSDSAQPQLSAEDRLEREHRGARVLLVEDEPLNQAVALELLREVGLDPVLATDGQQAVGMVESSEFAVVLMDLKMPRLDGVQATIAIRALPGCEKLPIIAMTANAFKEDRERCLAAGMNDFIGKPFDMDALCEKLLHWLPPVALSG